MIKTLGVIGGLGPMATAYFMELLTQMTDAKCDQEHLDIITYSKPSIPDRTAYIIGNSMDSPVPPMIEAGLKLKSIGADAIAIPCITAHCFHEELESGIGLPVIHAMKETAKYLKETNVTKVGLMATDGTVQSKIFQNSLEAEGIEVITPLKQKLVMKIIYDEVKSNKPVNMEEFNEVIYDLFGRGAKRVLLGCTELSVAKKDFTVDSRILDVLEVLSRSVLVHAGKLNPEYEVI